MAITGTDRGTASSTVSLTVFTFLPASNFAAGSMAVCCLALDNTETNGVAFSTFTLTDTLGNTWTRRQSPLYDPGAAAAGVEGAIFTTPMDGGTLTTLTVITCTTDVASTRHVATLMEVVPTAGSTISYVTGGVSTGSNTTTPTVTTGSITSGNMVVGGLFNEWGATANGDADSTNGTWSTAQQVAIGSSAGGMAVLSQRKVVTATATQTFNPVLDDSADCILAWIQLTETVIGASTVYNRSTFLGIVLWLCFILNRLIDFGK